MWIYLCAFCGAGVLNSASAKESLKQMQEMTGADFVIFAPNGVQKNAHSEEICYTSEATMTDEELVEMIAYAKELGLRVALKPTANCADGTWRHLSVSLTMMWCARQSGATGFHLTLRFSRTMQK